MAVDWSSLTSELVSSIAMKVPSIDDFISFSAVCDSWNRASSLIKSDWRGITPWLLLGEYTKDNPDCVRNVFNLCNNKCYRLNLPETFGTRCWGSAYGWVAMLDRYLNVQLFNPITNAQIHFPSLETIPNLPFTCQRWFREADKFFSWSYRSFVTKLIVLQVSQSGHHEFVIVVLCEPEYCSPMLAFARHEDQSWTPVFIKGELLTRRCYPYDIADIVGMDNYVIALYRDGSTVYWNIKETHSLEPVTPLDYSSAKPEIFEVLDKMRGQLYLVRSGSDLLMLIRYKDQVACSMNVYVDGRTGCFQAYKLDPEDISWEEIKDVGDVALFVGGGNSSLCVSTMEAKCLQRSCIYFTDDESNRLKLMLGFGGGHDMGVFDLKSELIWPFYKGDDTRSFRCPPIWFIPQF